VKPLAMAGGCCGGHRARQGEDSSSLPEHVRTEAELLRVAEAGRDDSSLSHTLLALLDERHPVYHGRSTPEVVRMRGAVLQALGHRALTPAALPFVLEELESPHDARLTAIAARLLRRFPEPSAAFAAPLMSALFNIRHHDETVRLGNDPAPGGVEDVTTATREILLTIGWLGQAGAASIASLEQLLAEGPGPASSLMLARAIEAIRSDTGPACTSDMAPLDETVRRIPPRHQLRIAGARFQDHSGAELTFAETFHGRPSIVVFFYTRCDNPTKCPLTMYQFGNLQRLLEQSAFRDSIATAAITYDSDYDVPERLLQYAQSWGATPSGNHRVLRTLSDFAAVSEYFSLGVNFSASGVVNRHQLEAYILDAHGHIAYAITRRRWDAAQLVELAGSLAVEQSTSATSANV
jgi:protein SCO1/2